MPSGKSDHGETLYGGHSTAGEVRVETALEKQASAIEKETAAIDAAAAAKRQQAAGTEDLAGASKAGARNLFAEAKARNKYASSYAQSVVKKSKAAAVSSAERQLQAFEQETAKERAQNIAQQKAGVGQGIVEGGTNLAIRAWAYRTLKTAAMGELGLVGAGTVGPQQQYFEKQLEDTLNTQATPNDAIGGIGTAVKNFFGDSFKGGLSPMPLLNDFGIGPAKAKSGVGMENQ